MHCHRQMKRLLLFTAILFSLNSLAQLEIKKSVNYIKIGGVTGVKLERGVLEEGDTLYLMLYRDWQYKSIIEYKSLAFIGEGTCNNFYNILKDFFKEENIKNKDYNVSIELDGKDIHIRYMPGLMRAIRIREGSSWFQLTERQLDKVFAKNL